MTDQLTLTPQRPPRLDVGDMRPRGLPIASKDPHKLTAARYMGVSRWTVQRLRDSGEIRGFHIGAASMIDVQSIDAYLERQRSGDGG